MAPGTNGKRWAFTINNFVSVDAPNSWDKEKVVFCYWQHERGAEGTPHLQGVVVLARSSRISALKKLHATAHWTLCNGTLDQNIEYCSKSDTKVAGPWNYGEKPLPAQGKRSDLLRLKDAVDEGRTELSIAEDDKLFPTWAKFSRAAERYKRIKTVRARNWPTFTTILWGPPGTGKTRYAHEKHPDAYWLKKPGKGQCIFFDGYEGQDCVIIDEFYGWLPYDLLCRMCDRYPLMVDTKGGMCNFYPKHIVITSNKSPLEWYKSGLQALERRFTAPLGEILFCGHGWVPPSLEEIPIIASANAQLMEVDAAAAACIPPVVAVDSPNINIFGSHEAECSCAACGPVNLKGHYNDCNCAWCVDMRCDEETLPDSPVALVGIDGSLSPPAFKLKRTFASMSSSSDQA